MIGAAHVGIIAAATPRASGPESGTFYRFDAVREFDTDWVTVQEWASAINSTPWGNYTHRVRVESWALSKSSKTKVRLTYGAAPGGAGASTTSVYVGVAANSGNEYDFAGTPVEVTFGGLSGFNLAAGDTITSDEIVLSIGETDDLLISGYTGSGQPGDFAGFDGRAGWQAWYKTGNDAATVDASGYSVNAVEAVGVVKIECFETFEVSAGAEEEWIVPPGVTSLRAYLVGASGAAGSYAGATVSGAGGYTVGTIAVTPGQTLKLRVGTRGLKPSVSPYAGGPGGWPGGGSGAGYTGFGDVIGGGGGGYSGIFLADETPLLIAGGGGGHCAAASRNAGAGGGASGQDADALTGSGGTQSAGGTSTGVSANGGYLQGASANNGDSTTETANTGGGGGGGYYGGGVSGTAYNDGGGGGGSGYIGGPGVTSAATYAGDGDDPPAERPAEINGETVAPRGNGVPGLYTERGQDGNDGVIWLEVL